MNARSWIAAVACGVGCGALGYWTGARGAAPSPVEAADRADDQSPAAAPPAPALLARGPEAAAESDREPSASAFQRQVVDAPDAAAVEPTVAGALAAELDAYLASGRLREELLRSESAVTSFLLDRYRAESRDEDILALLTTAGDPGLWAAEGRRWRSLKNPGLATLALQSSLELQIAQGGDRGLDRGRQALQELARIDLQLAADLGLQLHSASSNPTAEADFQLGAILARAGRTENAMELLAARVQDPYQGLAALEELIDVAPEAALEEIRRRAALGNDEGAAEILLARALSASGDTTAAIEQIDMLLRSSDDVLGLERGVAGIIENGEPGEWMDRLPDWADRISAGKDSWELSEALYNRLERLMEEGGDESDPEQAERMLGLLFDERVSNILSLDYLPEIPPSLRESHRPQILSTLRSMEQRAGANDEAWGDIGDRYWELGQVEDARRSWMRALAIDPQDGEWYGNLESLEAGTMEH